MLGFYCFSLLANEDLKGNQIIVDNTIEAIGKVATKWREQYQIPVIGITGSNGKTSTKELLRHILSSNLIFMQQKEIIIHR
ncbi:MAG: hypothetical protein Ct9H90mP7_3690 [Candidatus Neomarinimicrobiota bacterium]|nr:MAG: hypothetical protein Ct9H90mP7_3690 [Candidatus Neomarinimicrobiota bacterium]